MNKKDDIIKQLLLSRFNSFIKINNNVLTIDKFIKYDIKLIKSNITNTLTPYNFTNKEYNNYISVILHFLYNYTLFKNYIYSNTILNSKYNNTIIPFNLN